MRTSSPIPAPPPIHLYTSTGNHEARVFAERLAENLQSPVQVHDLDQLPAPDVLRTRRLRAEQAELRRVLEHDQALLQLTQPHESRYPDQVAALRADVARLEERLRVVGTQLADQAGGEGPC